MAVEKVMEAQKNGDEKQKEDGKESGNESWTSSDEHSSGNEYSVKMKNEKFPEDEALKELYRNKKKKKKKKKRKHKHKHKKKKSNGDSPGSCEDSDTENEKDNIEMKPKKKKKHFIDDDLLSKVDAILENAVTTDVNTNSDSNKSKHSADKKETESKKSSKDRKDSSSRSRSRSKDKKRKCTRSTDNKKRQKSQSRSNDRKRSRSRSKTRRKSRSHSRSKDRKRSRSRSKTRRKSRSRSRSKDRKRSRSRSKTRRKSRSRSRSRSKSRRKSRSRSKDRRRGKRSRSRSRSRNPRSRSRSRRRKSRSRSRSRKRSRSRSRNRRGRRSSSRDRHRSLSRDHIKISSDNKNEGEGGDESAKDPTAISSKWDVKGPDASTGTTEDSSSSSVFQKISALRRTGIEIKYGSTVTKEPTDLRESLNHRRRESRSSTEHEKNDPYGKWESVPVSEGKGKNRDLSKFTKLCLEISAKESKYESHVVDNAVRSSDEEDTIHHPFISKPAPMMPHTAFGRGHVPMNPAQAIMAGSMHSITTNAADIITGPLEKHFPVSSGTDHRDKEDENGPAADLPVFEEPATQPEPINVSAVIGRRLGAQQILNANPHDQSAKKVLEDCDFKLKGWTQRNRTPGKFTGERGAKKMDRKEIAGAIETWVRKDFFHNLTPVTGGVGMRMLQNMGWEHGTPLGKNREGYVAPIILDVKVGRSGLASQEEQPQRGRGMYGNNSFQSNHLPKRKMAPVVNTQGKHPVSALAEICSKRKIGLPEYSCVFEGGNAHNKTFLMKCTIQSVDYQPAVASPNKKHAKAQAAMTALKILGLDK